jgi:hypothetical protein
MGPLCSVGGNVKCCRYYGKQYGGSTKIKTELLHDPENPLLSIFPKELKTGS